MQPYENCRWGTFKANLKILQSNLSAHTANCAFCSGMTLRQWIGPRSNLCILISPWLHGMGVCVWASVFVCVCVCVCVCVWVCVCVCGCVCVVCVCVSVCLWKGGFWLMQGRSISWCRLGQFISIPMRSTADIAGQRYTRHQDHVTKGEKEPNLLANLGAWGVRRPLIFYGV